MSPLLHMAAGGTGGHMFPAQSLAEEMLSRGWRVQLSTDPRGARYVGNFPKRVDVVTLSSATFARGGALAKAAVPLRIGQGALGAIGRMTRDRPSCVIGFGGYPSIPALTAATVLRIPRLIHEQNGVLGRVNQVFARRVAAVACGTWPTELPEGVRGIDVGNPVRAAVMEHETAPYTLPAASELRVVVTGGSQGARILSDVLPKALCGLHDPIRPRLDVTHQARPEDVDRVRDAYRGCGIEAVVEPFFTDLPGRIARAHLVVARSGASTVADVSVIGRPAIFIPLATAIRDEQTANARALTEAGAALTIQERDLAPESLSDHIAAILTDPDRADRMARAAAAQGKPKAASDLADLVERTAQGDR